MAAFCAQDKLCVCLDCAADFSCELDPFVIQPVLLGPTQRQSKFSATAAPLVAVRAETNTRHMWIELRWGGVSPGAGDSVVEENAV